MGATPHDILGRTSPWTQVASRGIEPNFEGTLHIAVALSQAKLVEQVTLCLNVILHRLLISTQRRRR